MTNIKKITFKRRVKRIKRRLKIYRRRKISPIIRRLKPIILRYPQTKKENARDPKSEKPRVLVAGRTYGSNLCMARSLGEAGYEVESLRIFQRRPRRRNLMKRLKPDAYSKYVKAYHVCISKKRDERVLQSLKKIADPQRKMLLVPVDDLVAGIVDEYLEELKELYILPNIDNKAGELSRLMSKGIQKELAAKAGLPVINSCIIRTENEKFEIPESVKYPCFIKPNISNNSFKTKMKKCDSYEELKDTLAEYSKTYDIEWLVEDYVEIGNEYSVLGLSTKECVVAPGFFVAEEGGQKEHRGVALIGRLLSCSEYRPLIDSIVNFISSLKYEGLFDVDLIETIDGKMYFVELNLRFGGSGYAVTQSGVNLPGMYADYIFFSKAIDAGCEIKNVGKTFVNEKIMIDEYTKDRINFSKVRHCLKDNDIYFIKNDYDKGPYRHFSKFYLIALFTRTLYKVKNRIKKY